MTQHAFRFEPPPAPRAEPDADAASAFLDGLTEPQRRAASITLGPALVTAGPGAGKTRTLTARLGYLIACGHARPSEIVAVTFTRKAAAELRTRLAALLGPASEALTVGTFHRLAVLLRPLPAGVRILDESERLALAQQVVRAAHPALGRTRATQRAARLVQALSLCKAARSDWSEALARAELLIPEDPAESLRDELAAYEALRIAYHAEDLDDLLIAAVRALRDGSAERRFRFVSVDEYQDVSGVQRELVRALYDAAVLPGDPEPHRRSVFAIGDPDQAIYAFRGADVAHFAAFPKDFPGAALVGLRENFRAAAQLVEASAAVIAQNPERGAAGAPLAVRPSGAPLIFIPSPSLQAEALFIVREIERLVGGTSLLSHDQGRALAWAAGDYAFSDFAVLTRTAARADQLAESLTREGLPLVRPRRAHLSSEAAHELLAYLRFVTKPADPLPLWRVLDCELRALSPADRPERSPPSLNLADRDAPIGAVAAAVEEALGPRIAEVIGRRHALLAALPLDARLAAIAAQLKTPPEAVAAVRGHLARTGRLTATSDAASETAEDAPLLRDLLALADEADEWHERLERVAVLTLHGSKGLEFPVVFLSGCEAELIPGTPRKTDADTVARHLAEERRLFYVGLTRARDLLYLTHVSARTASPLLAEIPPHLTFSPPPPKRRPPPPQLKLF